MLGPQAARWHQQHVQQRPAVVGVVAGMRDAGQGGRECGLVVGPRGLEQGPDLGCFRLGIVAVRRLAIAVPGRLLPRHGRRWRGHRHRAVRQGHLERNAGAAASERPRPGFLSFQRPAGRRRAKQSLFAACVCLARDCRTGRLRPDQASCSGRVGLRPDLSDFGLRAARAKRNSSACPGCRLAASRRMRPCASRAIAYPRASVLPGSSARSCAGGGQPVARLQAQPRVAWPSCRAAFATRSPRGACRACDVPGVARARRRALRAPCGADQADASRKPRLFRRSR